MNRSCCGHLSVYRQAKELAVDVHRRWPDVARGRGDERLIHDQLFRCTASIGAVLAEGWGRRSSATEFRRYVRMALGEAHEAKYWLELAAEVALLDEQAAERWWDEYDSLCARLYKLATRWTSQGAR